MLCSGWYRSLKQRPCRQLEKVQVQSAEEVHPGVLGEIRLSRGKRNMAENDMKDGGAGCALPCGRLKDWLTLWMRRDDTGVF